MACVTTGAAALRAAHGADLVLLGIELSDLDGLKVCHDIRAGGDTPIIAITNNDTELNRVLCLQSGSDDCLAKPYRFHELLARIEAVMRRFRPGRHTTTGRVISRGSLRIDPGAREIYLDNRPVRVTRKEFDLLHHLAARPRTVVSRKEIMSQVWNDPATTSSRTVDTHVSSLRNKLGQKNWIRTVRGVGFRFEYE